MVTSYYKFESVKQSYKIVEALDAVVSLKAKLAEYEGTVNTEFLTDVANFVMIEFMYPQKESEKYKPTNRTNLGRRIIVGISVNEIRNIKNENKDWWLKY